MRLIGKAVLAVLLLIFAIWALKFAIGAAVFTVMLALRIAVFAAIVAGGVWAYRRLTGGGKRRRGPASLGSGKNRGSLDMQYIRGKIDRETYMRRKTMGS